MAAPPPGPGCLLFLTPEYPPILGGTGQCVADLAEALEGSTPLLVLTAGVERSLSTETRSLASIVRIPIPFRLARYFDATNLSLAVYACKTVWWGWRLSRGKAVRAVHAFHVLPTGLAAFILSRLLRVPYYVTAIGAEIHDPVNRRAILRHPLYRRLMRLVLDRARGVTAISRPIAEATRFYHAEKEIQVIHPGLKAHPSIPEKRDHAEFRLCTLCRLAPRKGIETVLEALAALGDIPYRYSILGDGPSRAALEALAGDLGVADRVEFHGFVTHEEKFAHLSQSDVFLLPSLYEGFGIAYLEAMACGLPIIAGSEGGQRDFLTDGENAVLLPQRTPEELAEALRRLHGDPALRNRMGAANRNKAAEFSMDRIAGRYLEMYRAGSDGTAGAVEASGAAEAAAGMLS